MNENFPLSERSIELLGRIDIDEMVATVEYITNYFANGTIPSGKYRRNTARALFELVILPDAFALGYEPEVNHGE